MLLDEFSCEAALATYDDIGKSVGISFLQLVKQAKTDCWATAWNSIAGGCFETDGIRDTTLDTSVTCHLPGLPRLKHIGEQEIPEHRDC